MALAFLDDPHRDFVECLPRLELRQHFEILRDLGHGYYAKVVLVRRRDNGELFAAKMIRLLEKSPESSSPTSETAQQASSPSSSSSSSSLHYRRARDQFQFELTLAYFLSPCPYIVRTYSDAFRTNHHLVALMEPALGGDLASKLKDPNVRINEQQLKAIAIQVASAIQFIHERSLVHGDIRPENVLLVDSSLSVVKLGDFSRTKKSGSMVRYGTIMMDHSCSPQNAQQSPRSSTDQSSAPPRRQSMSVLSECPVPGTGGTDAFSPPEICELSPSDFYTVHASQDVWGFGLVLFCLAVERVPSWLICSMKSDAVFADFIDALNSVLATSATSCDLHRQTSIDGTQGFYQTALSQLTSSLISLLRGLLEIDPSNRSQIKSVRNFTLSRWLVEAGGHKYTASVSSVPQRHHGSSGRSSPSLCLSNKKVRSAPRFHAHTIDNSLPKKRNDIARSPSNEGSLVRTFSETALDDLSLCGSSQVHDHASHTNTTSSPSTSFSAGSADDQITTSTKILSNIKLICYAAKTAISNNTHQVVKSGEIPQQGD